MGRRSAADLRMRRPATEPDGLEGRRAVIVEPATAAGGPRVIGTALTLLAALLAALLTDPALRLAERRTLTPLPRTLRLLRQRTRRETDRVDHQLDHGPLVTFLVLPRVRLRPARDDHLVALREPLDGFLGPVLEQQTGDPEAVAVLPLLGLLVLTAGVEDERDLRDRYTVRREAHVHVSVQPGGA